jgi:hypothetical protein
MRWSAWALLGLVLAESWAAPAAAQAWLTVGGADGSFRVDMPVPFDFPVAETDRGSVITFACVHETPEMSLRFEVLDAPIAVSDQVPAQGVLASRFEDDFRIQQTRVYVVGHRTFRLIAISTRELEGDPMIDRFLAFNQARKQSREFAPAVAGCLREGKIEEAISVAEQNKRSHLAKVVGDDAFSLKPHRVCLLPNLIDQEWHTDQHDDCLNDLRQNLDLCCKLLRHTISFLLLRRHAAAPSPRINTLAEAVQQS